MIVQWSCPVHGVVRRVEGDVIVVPGNPLKWCPEPVLVNAYLLDSSTRRCGRETTFETVTEGPG